MKKILSMFLALCMALTMLPVSAMAEQTHTTIGGEQPVEESDIPHEDTVSSNSVVTTTGSAIESEISEPQGSQVAMTEMFAEDNVNIGEIIITSANASAIQGLFDGKKLGNIAEVTNSGTAVKIKLLKNITGIIIIYTSNSSYILDANEKTFSGGGQNEAIQIENGYTGNTLELVGNGIYNKGVNNALYISSGNTLIIKSATINGNIMSGFSNIQFALEEGSSYFTAKNDNTNLFEEENTMTQIARFSINVTGTGLVVAQHSKDYYIGLDTRGTYTFPLATVGYGQQNAKTVTIMNTGKNDTGDLTIALSDHSGFSISNTSIDSLAQGETATFTIQPKDGLSWGSYTSTITVSNERISQSFDVSFAVRPTIPHAPTNLAIIPGDGPLTLTWTAPVSDGGSSIIRYEVSTDDGASWTSTGNTSTSYTVTGLTNGTNYTVKVRAVNAIGAGTASTGITVTLVPGTLTGTATISNVAPRIGSVMNGSLVGGNNTGTLTYIWKADGTEVGTGASYTVTLADLGKTITLEISSSVETGTITSMATATVLKKVAPSAPGAPTLISKTHSTVTLTANAAYEFSKDGTTWQSSNVFGDLTSSTAYTFYQRVAETPDTESSASSTGFSVTTNSNGGGSSSGSSSDSGSNSGSSTDTSNPVIVIPPTPDKPDSPTQGEIKVPGTVDGNGNVTVNITDKTVTDAFEKAVADAKKNGNEQNGITVVLRVDTGGKTASNVTVNLPKTVQDTILAKKIVSTVVVDNPDIRIGMDLATVQEINRQAKSDVNITAARADSDKLTGEAKNAIGSRPVFDIKVNYGKDKQVHSFGSGSVSVTIPYTLGANEKAENVQAIYVDGNGNVHWLTNSVYDSVEQVLRFDTSHFSTYGIGYKQTNTAFPDIADHWAKEDIEFVVSRGLFSGTSADTFSPNTAMTRGMFVTALGRQENADVSSYKQGSFTDVKSDAYYMDYIEGASKNGIVNGTSNGKFAPDQSITREQMAVIMQNYAEVMGFTLPKVHGENTFADSTKISAYAKDAVRQMQRAGVISGKKVNLFDPQGTATRAEVSAVLRRFVELVISSDTHVGLDEK